MIKEIFSQRPNWELGLKKEDLAMLESEFEKKWGQRRAARVIVENQNGSHTMFDTYEMRILKDAQNTIVFLREFALTASVLGYRSTMGPIVIPETIGDTKHISQNVSFFLERTQS